MAWAERKHIDMDTRLLTKRIIRVVLVQETTSEQFFLQGNFDDYKELPPIWDWWDEGWSKNDGLYLNPKPQGTPFGSSIFLNHNNKGIICTHFNRLAYSIYDGPHSDWGGPIQWVTAGPKYVHAVTIGDMLQSILRDFSFTKGRMG